MEDVEGIKMEGAYVSKLLVEDNDVIVVRTDKLVSREAQLDICIGLKNIFDKDGDRNIQVMVFPKEMSVDLLKDVVDENLSLLIQMFQGELERRKGE